LIELTKKIYKKNNIRNNLQEKYLVDIINQLNINSRVFIKAPTGFGKTHLYYKTIQRMKLKKILILTPRRDLNLQFVEDKYTLYIKDNDYKILHFSHLENKESIKDYINIENIIITSCYQSCKDNDSRLLDFIEKYKIYFDVIIFDEAHTITSWDNSKFINSDICKYRIFGSATPTQDIEIKSKLYGNICEKVKVYELMNYKILCDIVTLIKKIDSVKKKYHNLQELIIQIMIKYNKKKGIIYVNNCASAENLYKLFNEEMKVKAYIYTSNDDEIISQSNKINFEKNTCPSIIISVSKISYGYDNDYIDFICLADSRESDIDIRQIIGRGLRWNKQTYPNKILHLLIPLYKDEFENYQENKHLKKYLDYIIGECGKDIIYKDNSPHIRTNNIDILHGNNYDGDIINSEILNSYCTNHYNRFTNFTRFLIKNNINNEVTYNELYELNKSWMVPITHLKTKYPNFCFKSIDKKNYMYYDNKEQADINIIIAKNKLRIKLGSEKYSDLTYSQIIKQINIIDTKIPLVSTDLYY